MNLSGRFAPLRANTLSLIAMLAAILVVGEMATDMFLSSLPTLAFFFDASTSRVQLTLSVYLFGFALAQLVYGPLSDRFGRRIPLLAGTALFVVATIGAALSTSIEMLIALRFVQSLGGAAGYVIALAIVRDMHDRDMAASMLARMGTVIGLAPAIAPVIGGYLLVWLGWQANFVFLAAWAVLVMVLFTLLIEESNRHPDPHALRPLNIARNFGQLVLNRVYLGYALTMVFAFATFFAFISGAPFVFIEVLGVAPQNFAWLITVLVVGFVAGTTLADRLTRRMGVERLFEIAVLVAAFGGITTGLLPWLGIASIAGIIVPMVVFAFAMGFIFPLGTAGAIGPFPHMAGAAAALLGFLQSAAGAAFGVLVGLLHDGSVIPMTSVMGLTTSLSLAVFLMLLWRRPGENVDSVTAEARALSDQN